MGRGSSCDRWFGRRGDAYPSLRKAGRFGAGSSFAALDLERGFLCGVRGVGDGGGSVVLVPDFAVFGFMDFRRGAFSPEETDGLFPVSAVRAPSLRARKFSSVPVPSTSGEAESALFFAISIAGSVDVGPTPGSPAPRSGFGGAS